MRKLINSGKLNSKTVVRMRYSTPCKGVGGYCAGDGREKGREEGEREKGREGGGEKGREEGGE